MTDFVFHCLLHKHGWRRFSQLIVQYPTISWRKVRIISRGGGPGGWSFIWLGKLSRKVHMADRGIREKPRRESWFGLFGDWPEAMMDMKRNKDEKAWAQTEDGCLGCQVYACLYLRLLTQTNLPSCSQWVDYFQLMHDHLPTSSWVWWLNAIWEENWRHHHSHCYPHAIHGKKL